MQFLVLMVQRRGHVEIAHHVAGGLASRFVAAFVQQVLLQFGLQRQHALYPLVAGGEHFKRRFQTGSQWPMAGQGHGKARAHPHVPSWPHWVQ